MTTTINADNGVSSGSAGLKSSADSSGVLQLQTNGTAALTIDTSANVGIGTTSPAYKLHVLSADGAATSINAAATGRLRSFGYIDATRGALLDSINTAENAYLPFTINGSVVQFQTGATERARIDSSGNVGIGNTPSGTYKLEVTGAASATSFTGAGTGLTGTASSL